MQNANPFNRKEHKGIKPKFAKKKVTQRKAGYNTENTEKEEFFVLFAPSLPAGRQVCVLCGRS
jgi:hypothetical protein